LLISRLAIVGVVGLAVAVALLLPEKIFSRVLFAWIALGSAFGPLVFFRLAGAQLAPAGIWLAILTGFALSVIFYLLPNTTGDILERLVPFVCGCVILFFSRRLGKS
jgi:Na+/proline symporter